MKITFVGGGNMATALIGGLLKTGQAPEKLSVIEISPEGRARLEQNFGVRTYAAPEAAALAGDVVLLAVKPQHAREVCATLAPFLGETVLVSIAAGIRVADLSRWLGGHSRVVRAMPNTPALIGAGVTGLYASAAVTPHERALAERILAAAGETLWVRDETQIDAVTAVSGSGPAYLFLLVEAMQQAASELGLSAEAGRRLAVGTVLGAAQLAAQTGEPASVLRERVTSKGGTTAAALAVMAERCVKEGIVAGVLAADERSRELGDQLGHQGEAA
ncbi:pyrroline-5-carboxylate reductase [Rhodocyclus gracilis]|uniref:Pyrroline-5-carboxylate reductase n=1 Tax=Rhodocyclus tenuis TaxID=1066 RepID=A0A6L5JWJ0_RHOTE|nr:pyrroline-5-carboxylate reductase [Rhodocyclus gracilis]MQY51446.1 pyrroline-5-carboxylate reductase [Rhodocyclus gracilis]